MLGAFGTIVQDVTSDHPLLLSVELGEDPSLIPPPKFFRPWTLSCVSRSRALDLGVYTRLCDKLLFLSRSPLCILLLLHATDFPQFFLLSPHQRGTLRS